MMDNILIEDISLTDFHLIERKRPSITNLQEQILADAFSSIWITSM